MEELLSQLIAYAGDDYTEDPGGQGALLETLLEDAVEEVVNHMYPFGIAEDTVTTVVNDQGIEENVVIKSPYNDAKDKALKRYKGTIRRIAEYHYDKVGKEGVTHFNENGSYGTYEASGTPASYFVGIMPVAQIV